MNKLPIQLNTYSPLNKAWTQTNRSDIFGALVGSFNLDLNSNVGKVRGTKMLTTTTQNAPFGETSPIAALNGVPVGFKLFNDSGTKIFTAVGASGTGKVLVSVAAAPFANFAADSDTSTPTDCDSTLSDIEVFNNALFVTANTKLYKNGGLGSWVNNALAGSGPWPMTVYAGRLYIANAGLGTICSTSDGTTIVNPTNQYALNLNDLSARTTFLRSSSNRIWIGQVNPFGKANVYEWDGSAGTITRPYRMESNGALACVIKDDLPWIVDANGKLLQYSNGTFKEVARLPISQKFLVSATSTTNNRFIHPNGMTVVDGKINILINNLFNDDASDIAEFCPSGIWEFDELSQTLYHKYSFSYTLTGGTTVHDYGQNRVAAVGALSEMKTLSTSNNYTGDLIAGATIYSDASTTDNCIFTNDTIESLTNTYKSNQRSLYFVTEKFTSEAVKDLWKKVTIKHRQFRDSGDSLIVKYRITESDPVEISITWTSTSTFTTTTNVLAYFNVDTQKGYEVEIVQGTGGGKTAHITKIDVAGSTYTVTLDDTFTGATGTAKARIQNWTRVVLTATDSQQNHEFPIGKASEWIQLKVCAIFKYKDEIDELIVANSTQQDIQ